MEIIQAYISYYVIISLNELSSCQNTTDFISCPIYGIV